MVKVLASQGPSMKAYLDIFLAMEISFHPSLNKYTKCLKKNLGPSSIALEAVRQGRAAYEPSNLARVWIWMRLLLQFLIPLAVFTSDIVLDVLLVASYWIQYHGKLLYSTTSVLEFTIPVSKTSVTLPNTKL